VDATFNGDGNECGGQRWRDRKLLCGLPDCYRCADRDYRVNEYLVVHPGDDVVFSMPEGALQSGAPACEPDCGPALHIYKECPRRQWLDALPLREGGAWKVWLPSGRYLLAASSYFVGDDGSGGSTSSAFGIIVDADLERGRETASSLDGCRKTSPERAPEEDAGT
jgi:hypothetical protein